MTKKVKFSEDTNGITHSFRKGVEYELDDEIADFWLADGRAKLAVKKASAKREKATVEAKETREGE